MSQEEIDTYIKNLSAEGLDAKQISHRLSSEGVSPYLVGGQPVLWSERKVMAVLATA